MKNDRTEITTFDLTKTYDKEIAPLVKKLENMCLKYEIPVFITCCAKSTKDETFYKNTMANSPVSSQINLKVNTFPRHIGVCRGFEVTPRRFQEDIDEEFLKYELDESEIPKPEGPESE